MSIRVLSIAKCHHGGLGAHATKVVEVVNKPILEQLTWHLNMVVRSALLSLNIVHVLHSTARKTASWGSGPHTASAPNPAQEDSNSALEL
jgi:hypothetical protein